MKGAPKTQQMQNKMLFLEMQRYHVSLERKEI